MLSFHGSAAGLLADAFALACLCDRAMQSRRLNVKTRMSGTREARLFAFEELVAAVAGSAPYIDMCNQNALNRHTCSRNIFFGSPLSLEPRRQIPKRNNLSIEFRSFVDVITSQESSATGSDSADVTLDV